MSREKKKNVENGANKRQSIETKKNDIKYYFCSLLGCLDRHVWDSQCFQVDGCVLNCVNF